MSGRPGTLRGQAAVLALTLGLLAAFPGCTCQKRAGGQEGGTRAVLFVAADLRGYVAPCGCSENMRGGIARAAEQIALARRSGTPTFFVEGGDSLFGPGPLEDARVLQEERKARALAQSFRQMGLQVRFRGELDDARGDAFRRSLELPDLSAGEHKVLEASGVRLGVAAGNEEPELLEAARKARESSASFVVALYHRPVADAQRLAANPALQADLLVATHGGGGAAGDSRLLHGTGVPVVQLQDKGQALLRVDLALDGGEARFQPLRTAEDVEKEAAALQGRIDLLAVQVAEPGVDPALQALKQKKIEELVVRRATLLSTPPPPLAGQNAFSLRVVPLDAALPTSPEVKATVDAYDRDVSTLNLQWARQHGKDCPDPTAEEPGFVGNERCEECHDEAFEVYRRTKHAHAYDTLRELGKQYHLDCFGCHVTGAHRPGGVCRVDKMEGREHVGCESCHGPGSTHADDPSVANIVRSPDQSVCVRCHEPENSPHFDFSRYLPQVLGAGHGKKAPGPPSTAKKD